MMRFLYLLLLCTFCACNSTTYYIIRHAEKETNSTMAMDVPLSDAGKARALALKETLKDKHITSIFSTNYNRTLSTVEPLRSYADLTIHLYDIKDTLDGFINYLRHVGKGNVLIVGHSNTVPVIVNRLMGEKEIPSDLSDNDYGDLFIVKKSGNKYSFTKSHFGTYK